MASESMELSTLLPLIQEVLAQGNDFLLHPRGHSMYPTLLEGRDSVMLSPVNKPFRRGDILLYRRKSGVFVMHRVVKVEKDGTLTMRGDAQYVLERGIRREQVIAIINRYFRKKKKIKVRSFYGFLYRTRRHLTYPVRHLLYRYLQRRARKKREKASHG